MNWFFIALIAPALWAIGNHIDKYLINKYFKNGGVGSLIIFSALIGIFILPFILLIHPAVFNIRPLLALLITANGLIFIVSMLPYLYALEADEASTVVPLFQMIPVFSYVLGAVVLGEVLSGLQIVASFLVLAGAVALSFELDDKRLKLKKKVFWLMFLSSFLVALNALIFKFVAIQGDFWTTSFWEYIGFAILSVILLVFVKSYRNQFFFVIKTNKKYVLQLNILNEVLNIIGKMVMNFATLLAPLAIVWVINGFQPFFVLFFGIILTLFFPQLGKESLLKRHLFHKILSIAIMFMGVYLLNI